MMENKTADYKNFNEISKRLAKSGYKKFIVHNRMIMGFYDLTQDSDVGMHYIMHVPDEYEDLYDGHFIFDNDKFTKQLAEIRNKAKGRELNSGYLPELLTDVSSIVRKMIWKRMLLLLKYRSRFMI